MPAITLRQLRSTRFFLRYIHPVQSLFPCIFPSASLLSLSSFVCNPFFCPPRSAHFSYRSLSLFSILVVIFSLRRRCWWGLGSRLGFRYLLRCRRAALVHTAKSSASYRCNTFANESEKLESSFVVSSRDRILPRSFLFSQEHECSINVMFK